MLVRKDLPRSTAAEPAVPVIHRIQQTLASAGAPGSFATRHTAGVDDIHFDVVDVGAVPLPLSHRTAQKLCEVARPARYGLREKTLLDPRVRDTWEIGKRQIKLDTHWQRTLDPKLELIARDLGLPDGAKLRAELHNLLVYGPGQFFAPHQDSEKADGMIGSLVVLLPSDSKGGALVIEHHDEEVSYRGSPTQLVLVAFYADCRHEVRPVTSGYRAALTFNLFLDAPAHRRERPASRPVDALIELVRDYFATPRPRRGPHWPSEPAPERLVYLLDHEYTQNGLSWQALKNGDAVRASLLREVAERLDCEIVLALADVHETWSCEDEGGYYGYGRRGRGWYARYDEDARDEDGPGAVGEDYTLIELCNSDVELRHWVGPSDKRARAISGEVRRDEICFTKPSVDLEPFKSEHEGYTGNAGNTVDRWYHRAAVMLWPRARTFAIRAKASPAWGIREIAKLIARGKADVAKQRIGELLAFWNSVAPHETAADLADQVLHVAHAIDDVQLATALVEPIRIEQITPKLATHWGELLLRYGLAWCAQVFERWTSCDERTYDHAPRTAWLASLPALSAPLCTGGGPHAVELVRRIVRAQWTWLNARLAAWTKPPLSSHSLETIEAASRPLIGLLAAAALADDRDLQSTIVARLVPERGYPIAGALAVLRAGAPQGAAMLGLGPLHDDCTRTLTMLVATAPRAPADWSITTQLGCKCELCTRLGRFLRTANEPQLEWPLAKDRRAHVHGVITSHELPVTHVTRRTGSPYTLVLTKTRALFTRDAAERATWMRDLAWLRERAKRPRRLRAQRK